MEGRNGRIERKRKTKERDLSGMVSSSLFSVHLLLPTTRKDNSILELPTPHDTAKRSVFFLQWVPEGTEYGYYVVLNPNIANGYRRHEALYVQELLHSTTCSMTCNYAETGI